MPTAASVTAHVKDKQSGHSDEPSMAVGPQSRGPDAAVGVPAFLQCKPAAQAGELNGPADGLAAGAAGIPRYVQAGLAVSRSDEPSELEAERVAAQVMRTPEPASEARRSNVKSSSENAAGEVTRTRASSRAQATPGTESPLGSGRTLPDATHRFFASRMGADFSDVRIHQDDHAARLSTGLHARAFTYGSHIAFAPGEYDADSTAGKRLLAHELTHVLQQRGRSARRIQRDLALTPPKKAVGPPPTLTDDQIKAAIAYNKARFKGVPQKIMHSAENIAGVRRDATALDEVFANAIAAWQNWWNLPIDGRMTPMTAHIFASELRAEAANLRKWKLSLDSVERFEESARHFDAIAAGPLRDAAVTQPLSTGSWTPPSGVDKLRGEIAQDLNENLAEAVPRWRDRAYDIRASSTLSEDDRGEYLAEIAAHLSGKKKMTEAMEVVSLIDVVSESARKQMGSALSRVAANATADETTARDYLRMLVRMAGLTSQAVADPRAWLEANTEAVGQAIRALERTLGAEISRQLTSSVLKTSFTKDLTFSVEPSGAGRIASLPKDPKAGNRLLADCDVYAVYAMRLLRAQGWETVGYFTFQGETKDDIAHAVGIARRKTGDKTEYAVIDSNRSPEFMSILEATTEEAAKAEADKRGGGWAHHFYAPAIGGGAINPRLNSLHPEEFRYPPGSP